MKTSVKSICAAIAATIAVSVFAAVPSSITKFVPEYINYQGYLANPTTGAPYTDGLYTIQCRLYREASGGMPIWGAKYSVYVKDGYFNIMLGDDNAADLNYTYLDLNYTYKKNELWKALWYDTAASERNNLWLGVTPEQNAANATIASPTEISPRQQLLAAPYAFRAQAAEYAEQSIDAFKVNGALTVSGSATFSTNFTVPSGIKSDGNSLSLGGTTTIANSANPIVYNVGRTQYFRPYYDWSVSPKSGNVTFTIPSGKSFTVSTTTNLMTSTVTQMKSNGATTIEAGSIQMKGSLTYGKYVGSGYVKPFVIKTINLYVDDKSKLIEANGDYNWVVVGFDTNPVGSWDGELAECYAKRSGNNWYVYVKRWTVGSEDDTVDVHLLGIHRSLSTDNR